MAIPDVFTIGKHNAITDGGYFVDIPTTITFIRSSDDLALITGMEPGDLAATYGMAHIWQWDDEDWQEV